MKYLIWLSNECTSVREVVIALKDQGIDTDLLLVQDGVYLADKGCPHSAEIEDLNAKVYASRHHVEERGIGARLVGDVHQVDYPEIIDLLMERYDKVISF
ncbi:MAG: sulfurtransferase complex subunit TusB [Candidatus Thorarchaeota archaeon]|nr:sulfurtransferase complex subunit TusB [Candidatus Thorarchaeota archaeon]